MLRYVLMGTAAVGLFATASTANAAPTAVGHLYAVTTSISQNAIPANVPAGPANVVFTAPSNPLSFFENTNSNTVSTGAWLASGGATINSSTPGALTRPINNSLLNFTGTVTVTTGETFTVNHDDGLTLIIGGVTVINTPGPTAPITTTATYTGPSGNEPFQLVYGECCGGPAVLNVALPLVSPPVPEPTTLAILGTALAGVGFLRRRRRR